MDLAALARDATDEAWPQAQAKHIRIERELDVEEPWVRGDRDLLARALANLLIERDQVQPVPYLRTREPRAASGRHRLHGRR